MTRPAPTRRGVLSGAAAALAAPTLARGQDASPAPLFPVPAAAPGPITTVEREGRLEALRRRLRDAGLGGLVVESGSTLEYLTGVSWRRSERPTAAFIPAVGETILVCPVFEEPSVRESLAAPAEVRPWNEDESPYRRLAEAVRDRGAATATLAAEPTTRFFILEGLRREAPGVALVDGGAVVDAGRMIKSRHELDLLSWANHVTLEAIRAVHAAVRPGMEPADISALMDRETLARGGGAVEFNLVLLNEASAYPHGSHRREQVRDGSVILMDCGCAVHGYQSDISRTFVYGEPAPGVRRLFDLVRRGQETVLAAARPGRPAGEVDEAVRRLYEAAGFGPGYRLPGLSHRAGHGIGLDGHEAPYLVRGETRRLEPGMCFSDEPGLYVPGSYGVRLEDCWTLTPTGPALFTPLARSLEDPI